ncbi:MAG: tetratricopeptide repeat protein [Prevotella sp.]|jgi:tetratricopeptide (TPR) repeat protein|nr:tetratricopeptide repeat protein [Prevotella sp.]
MKHITIAMPFLLTSCNAGSSTTGFGIASIVAMFVLMFILFAVMFFLIAKRKKQGEKSLARFNSDVCTALNKLSSPQQKINMLNKLIERINNEEKYKKDTDWRNKVLVKTYIHLAIIHYRTGNEMETLNICTKITELDPEDGIAYYNRGSIYSSMGLYEKALQDFNRTIELKPDHAGAYNNRGLTHEKMEHYDEALADFGEAIKLEGSPIARYNRGNTHYELGNYQAALDDYQAALDNPGTDSDPVMKNDVETSIRVTKGKLANTQN